MFLHKLNCEFWKLIGGTGSGTLGKRLSSSVIDITSVCMENATFLWQEASRWKIGLLTRSRKSPRGGDHVDDPHGTVMLSGAVRSAKRSSPAESKACPERSRRASLPLLATTDWTIPKAGGPTQKECGSAAQPEKTSRLRSYGRGAERAHPTPARRGGT